MFHDGGQKRLSSGADNGGGGPASPHASSPSRRRVSGVPPGADGLPGSASLYGTSGAPSSIYGTGPGVGATSSSAAAAAAYVPMGSLYGMVPAAAPYTVSQSWANMATLGLGMSALMAAGRVGGRGSYSGDATPTGSGGGPRRGSGSGEAAPLPIDMWPRPATFEGARDVPRSGRRGGNRFYSLDKRDFRAGNVILSGSQSNAMKIRRKPHPRGGSDGIKGSPTPSSSSGTATGASPGRGRSAAASQSPGVTPTPTPTGLPRGSPPVNINSTNNSINSGAPSHPPSRAPPPHDEDDGEDDGGGLTRVVSTGLQRAAAPTNFDVHSLLVVDRLAGAAVSVKDANTVVYAARDGRKDSFACDEALPCGALEGSVLLSELRGNWFAGHNCSLLVGSTKATVGSGIESARLFIAQCGARLERARRETGTEFDITITMANLLGPEHSRDLLRPAPSHAKSRLGASPVFGPCLLDLETRTARSASEFLDAFDAGVAEAQPTGADEITMGLFVLKTVRRDGGGGGGPAGPGGAGAGVEVHLSSLCVALFRDQLSVLTGIQDKECSTPHRLFRYAMGGTSVTTALFTFETDDAAALRCLEVARRVRAVSNRQPRSGNIRKFIEYTRSEMNALRRVPGSGSAKARVQLDSQIARMEAMVADATALLEDPENTQPKGYAV